MNMFSFIKKSMMVLSILPLLSLAVLHADDSGVAVRGERRPGMHHESAGHYGAEGRGVGVEGRGGLGGEGRGAAFNRGAEAGAIGGAAAVGGAAIDGAGVAAPVYMPVQPQVQYVTPQPLPPQ